MSRPNFFQRLVMAALTRRDPTTGQVTVAGVDAGTWFGPQQPLKPMAPETDVKGRRYDYPTALNVNYVPRATEPVNFQVLKYLSQAWPILRLCIETRKDQAEAQTWSIRPREVAKGKRPALTTKGGRIQEITEFFQTPDKRLDWAQWLRAVLDQHFVYDGVAIYRQRNRGGKLYALQQVDAATIKPIIDKFGRTPLPPSPAYQQVLKGVPASDYTTFAAGELLYETKNVRVDHLYGYGPVEQIVTYVEIGIQRMVTQRSYFTEGNIPDGFLSAGEGATPDQLAAIQANWDAIFAGNAGQKHKALWVPYNSKWQPMKLEPLKDDFDEWLARVVCYAFSLSPQWAVRQMNRATAGTAQEVANEEGLQPTLLWVKRLMDKIIREDFEEPTLEFVWESDAEFDPQKAAVINSTYAKLGIKSIDDVRDDLGLDKWGGWASKPMVLTPTGYVPIEPQVPPEGAPTGAAPGKGGKGGGANPTAIDTNPKPPAQDAALRSTEKRVGHDTVAPVLIKRPLINAYDLAKWAEAAGFTDLVPWEDIHVVVAESQAPVDWSMLGDDMPLVMIDGGARMVAQLDDRRTALLFQSQDLEGRWAALCASGCSWDHDGFNAYVVIANGSWPVPPGLDADEAAAWEPVPFDGQLVFGEEEWSILGVEQFAKGAIDDAAARVDPNPSQAQIAAGNYRKGHVRVQGLDITLENVKGGTRSGVHNGTPWSVTMPAHYGYVKRTTGADGDHVDVYVGPDLQSSTVFVIDQINADTGEFDEHKCMVGYSTAADAMVDYHAAFSDGRGAERLGSITSMNMGEFKLWLDGDTTQPVVGVGKTTVATFRQGRRRAQRAGQSVMAAAASGFGGGDPYRLQ